MKKTLLLSAVSVAGAAALVGGMTFAAFNDTELAKYPSAVAAGTLELDQEGVTEPAWVLNMSPGQTAEFAIDLENEGTLDGTLYAKIHSITGHEDGCDVADGMWDPERVESVVDMDCWNVWSPGDLVEYLDIVLVAPDATEVDLTTGAEVNLGALAAHGDGTYMLKVTFRDAPLADKWVIDQQNKAQGDSACIQLKFALVADAPTT